MSPSDVLDPSAKSVYRVVATSHPLARCGWHGWLLCCGWFDEVAGKDRHDGQRDDQRRQQGKGDGQREGQEELPNDAANEAQRQKDADGREGAGGDRARYFAGASATAVMTASPCCTWR